MIALRCLIGSLLLLLGAALCAAALFAHPYSFDEWDFGALRPSIAIVSRDLSAASAMSLLLSGLVFYPVLNNSRQGFRYGIIGMLLALAAIGIARMVWIEFAVIHRAGRVANAPADPAMATSQAAQGR